MKNSKEILQAENIHEEVKQESKAGSKIVKLGLVALLLLSVTILPSCYWGRGHGHEGHSEHHEEHHDDHR